MSDESSEEELSGEELENEGEGEEKGEEEEEEKGEEEEQEVDIVQQKLDSKPKHPVPEEENALTKLKAGQCLRMLGRTGNVIEHAYLKIEATNMGLTDISIIAKFRFLEFVDVSNNHLKTQALHCLSNLKNLVMIIADGNIIDSLEIPLMPFLQVLSLSDNEIQSTSGLKQPIIESLNLNNNLIKVIEGLEPAELQEIRNLEFRGNALTTTSGISFATLRSLYLADNLINKLEGLEALVNLQRLHLRGNRLSRLDGFSNSMEKLKYLNLRNNKIENLLELKKLSTLSALEIVVVLENPFAADAEEDYRVEVLVYLPKLKRIDKELVQEEELEEADERRAEREEELGGEEEANEDMGEGDEDDDD
ncbi:hypothetical protein C0J52_15099 [Blattella germanica]|nr:hypothetical protein C0J52_15099 [Blattella germanica]